MSFKNQLYKLVIGILLFSISIQSEDFLSIAKAKPTVKLSLIRPKLESGTGTWTGIQLSRSKENSTKELNAYYTIGYGPPIEVVFLPNQKVVNIWNEYQQLFGGNFVYLEENDNYYADPEGVYGYTTPFVKIVSPNGFENYLIGESTSVHWKLENDEKYKAVKKTGLERDLVVDIYFSGDGTNYSLSYEGVPATGFCRWDVPQVLSDYCKMRVCLRDPWDEPGESYLFEDESDSLFHIHEMP